ncbi:glycosyltransferase family 2 protein [Brevibacillus ginsengisoli]|uniref:glycosyltransferase family 2 protein n=1 Tax=Brevibacillus ginsengisoli TaxID=363854 RepID=UPI003CEAF0A4
MKKRRARNKVRLTSRRLKGGKSTRRRKWGREKRGVLKQWRFRRSRIAIPRASVDYTLIMQKNKEELSVIIASCHREESAVEQTIEQLLRNVQKIQPKEIIVVENSSTNTILTQCLKYGALCFSYGHLLGPDVGRAIGALKATGSILLFIDADMLLSPEEMLPFVAECYGSKDIVLNNMNPYRKRYVPIDSVRIAKSFLNRILRIPELKDSSLTEVPHAMKKSAVDLIGADNLCVPPKAMAIAVLRGLKIGHVAGVNVIKKNRIIPSNSSDVEQMILGDHVEALYYIQQSVGNRGFFTDATRRLDLL